jgi:hypothetical protein
MGLGMCRFVMLQRSDLDVGRNGCNDLMIMKSNERMRVLRDCIYHWAKLFTRL